MVEDWYEKGIDKNIEKNKNSKIFSFQDGQITANNQWESTMLGEELIRSLATIL